VALAVQQFLTPLGAATTLQLQLQQLDFSDIQETVIAQYKEMHCQPHSSYKIGVELMLKFYPHQQPV
jgi:hypothetical protein